MAASSGLPHVMIRGKLLTSQGRVSDAMCECAIEWIAGCRDVSRRMVVGWWTRRSNAYCPEKNEVCARTVLVISTVRIRRRRRERAEMRRPSTVEVDRDMSNVIDG